jgi:hypothetical protein
LPGQSLVVFDPQLSLVMDVYPCQDAHAQERSLVPQVLERVVPGDLWMADRNFCTSRMLFGVAQRGGCFLIRQHQSTLRWEALGTLRACGRTDSGKVYEQEVVLVDPQSGVRMYCRRVILKLNKPTRDGETQIAMLSNLPAEAASAGKIARLYHGRWTIERAFAELTASLSCEIDTLGYPAAALLAFCVALVAYNAVSVVKAAMGAVHGREKIEQEVSGYYLAAEIASTYEGMMIAVPPQEWACFATMPRGDFVKLLKKVAGKLRLQRYRKHPRGPKKPRPPRSSGKRHKHVSTARLLALRRTAIKIP